MTSESEASWSPRTADLFDPDKFFSKHLCEGFSFLRKCADEESAAAAASAPSLDLQGTPDFLSKVRVNVVDPTSSTAMVSPTHQPLELYQKISSQFERDHQSTLQNVAYQNFRSGAEGTIARLPVRFTHSQHGVLEVDADPAEWHMAPYCHVYIAACENLEHYRTKVKPSIQIFIRQLKAAAASAAAAAAATTSGSSPSRSSSHHTPTTPFLIVYVPTGQRTGTTGDDGNNSNSITPEKAAASTLGSRRVAAFASRVAAARETARQRMAGATTTTTASSEATSVAGSDDAMDTDSVVLPVSSVSVVGGGASSAAQQPSYSPQLQLSKVEREIVKRLTADFGVQGRVCTLSAVLFDGGGDAAALDDAAEEHQLVGLEWESFKIELGATIIDGFRDRCRRYDEELKRLGGQLAMAKEWNEALGVESPFNLSQLLLVKESFAFTYEQIRQHAEALLQYEELQALLPDFTGEHFLKHVIHPPGESIEATTRTGGNKKSFLQIALSGDTLAFRQRLQSLEDFASVVHEIEHYVLVRQTALLFGMKDPTAVVTRCHMFVMKLYEVKRSEANLSNQTDALLALNRWSFEFCWDVKGAVRIYSSVGMANGGDESEFFARAVCDILDFARHRYSDMGKIKFPDYKPPQFLGGEELPPELNAKWEPWVEPQESADAHGAWDFELPETGVLGKALSSQNSFEIVHAKVSTVLATYMEWCGRRRYAACLRLSAVDIAVRRNQLTAAEQELWTVARTYDTDNWRACNFFLLFQLAKLQRGSKSAETYLGTLVNCFSNTASPSRALKALFDDLVAVVRCPSMAGKDVAGAPIFKPALGLEDYSMLKFVGSDRHLLKKVYSVGDNVPITLSIFSQLPKDVQVKKITVSLVPFQTYVSKVEDSVEITAEDVLRTLSLSHATIHPGRNDLKLEWTPVTTGQFILAGLSLQWECSRFSYSAKGMNRPTVRVDVLPCDPTQSLEIVPKFLVPGHEQPAQIIFHTGKDIIETGSIQLVGSSGVLLCEADADRESRSSWNTMMTLDLPFCSSGHTETFHILVKSEIDKETGAAAALHVQTTTFFRPEVGDSESKEEEIENGSTGRMECSLSKSITTLGKAAFVVDAAEIVAYAADRLLINAALHSNAPSPFILKKWSIDLPSCLELRDMDLNGSLLNCTVTPLELLSLAFDCRVRDVLPLHGEATLHITYDNGAGTTFTDSLAVGLKRPTIQPMQKVETEDVVIEVSPLATSGLVGSPIDIECSIDTTRVSYLQGREIRYAVFCESDAWLLHGKTEGVLKMGDYSSIHKLGFVAFPTRPGSITDYLSISLSVDGEGGRLMELPVKFSQPPAFDSFDPPSHTTVAFLAT